MIQRKRELPALFNPFGGDLAILLLIWQGQPELRGSCSMITFCRITLGLCFLTALYLNISTHRKFRLLNFSSSASKTVAYTICVEQSLAIGSEDQNA